MPGGSEPLPPRGSGRRNGRAVAPGTSDIPRSPSTAAAGTRPYGAEPGWPGGHAPAREAPVKVGGVSDHHSRESLLPLLPEDRKGAGEVVDLLDVQPGQGLRP